MNRKQWEDRRGWIGASDVAAIMGLSRYKGPLGVYREKVGEAQPSWSPPALRGLILEPVIDAVVGELAPGVRFQPRMTCGVLRANPDYATEAWVGDAKTTTAHLRRDFRSYVETGEIKPGGAVESYIVQMHAAALCFAAKEARLFVLFADFSALEEAIADRYAGRAMVWSEDLEADLDIWQPWRDLFANRLHLGDLEIEEIVIPVDPALCDAVQAACTGFWHHVEDRTPPAPTAADLGAFDGDLREEEAEIPHLDAVCKRLAEVKSDISGMSEEKKALEDQIKSMLVEANCDRARGAEHSARWTLTKPRVTVDAKRLAKEYPDVYTAVSREGKPSRRLTVK